MATYYVNGGSGSIGSGTYRGIWVNSQTWAVGDRVAPTRAYATAAAKKYIYECTSGGAGGSSEPTWVYTTPETSTTTSSSAVFTCREIDDWTNAGVYVEQATRRVSAAGDIIKVHYTTQDEVTVDIYWDISAANDISIISVDKNNSDAFTPMGTSGWLGNSSSTITIGMVTSRSAIRGITFRLSGVSNTSILLSMYSGQAATYDNCYFWCGTSGGSSSIDCNTNNPHQIRMRFKDCTFRFAHTNHYFGASASGCYFEGCSISAAGTTPNYFVRNANNGSSYVEAIGCDFSNLGTSLTPDNNSAGGTIRIVLRQCKIPGTLVTTQTWPAATSVEVWAFDCAIDDTHYSMIYNNGVGELSVSGSFYVTADGAEYNSGGSKHSWKIVTSANVSFAMPFITPWISVHNEVVSPTTISPYLEALSATSGLNESDVWAEFAYKTTSGYPTATIDYSDAGGYALASTTDQGASSLTESDWTETGTNYTYKLAPSGALTADEIGDLSARVVVAKASTTIYVDPQIRGL